MIYVFGLLIAVTSVVGSIFHLHQAIGTYFDVVALFVVLGGTISVGVITIPWNYWPEIRRSLRCLFAPPKRNPKILIRDAMNLVETTSMGSPTTDFKVVGLAGDILRDGSEMISLGFSEKTIEEILFERIHQNTDRLVRVANALRGLSKYPPAFGLMGTVLGLVSLMRALSDSANSQETGMRMAVALVATLYGLLMSNLVLNPAGEHVLKYSVDEKKDAELAMAGVLLAAGRTPILEAHEMLNSYVHKKDRMSFASSGGGAGTSGQEAA